MTKRKTKKDKRGTEYVYYGNDLAKVLCNQVPLVTFADRKNVKFGQVNYVDNDDYLLGFTKHQEMNYVCSSVANRVAHTKDAYDTIKTLSPKLTKDW